MAAVIGRGLQRGVGDGDQEFCRSPFIAYYIVVLSLKSVAIVGGVISQMDLHSGQSQWYGYGRCDGWLVTNAFFGVIHILAALYIVRKMQEPEDAIELSPMDYQLQQQQPAQGGGKPVWWQGNKVHVQPIQPVQLPQWEGRKPVVLENSQKCMGPPHSWVRVKHVMMENFVVAIYMLLFLAYLLWHMFADMNPCNDGMWFAQKCANIFVMAAPCAFVYSVCTMLMNRRQL